MFNDYTYVYIEDDSMSREIMMLLMDNVLQINKYVILPDSNHFMERIEAMTDTPDYFLLDIHMEPIDGFEMIAQIRQSEQYRHAKVIALTASVMNEEISKLREAGFDGAIGKPLSVSTFPNLLREIIEGQSVWHVV